MFSEVNRKSDVFSPPPQMAHRGKCSRTLLVLWILEPDECHRQGNEIVKLWVTVYGEPKTWWWLVIPSHICTRLWFHCQHVPAVDYHEWIWLSVRNGDGCCPIWARVSRWQKRKLFCVMTHFIKGISIAGTSHHNAVLWNARTVKFWENW